MLHEPSNNLAYVFGDCGRGLSVAGGRLTEERVPRRECGNNRGIEGGQAAAHGYWVGADG